MKKIPFAFIASVLLLAGCSTTTVYKPAQSDATMPSPKPADYPIPVYTENMDVPRPCHLIGKVTIGHTGLTVMGGSIDKEMEKVMKVAHQKGADVIQIASIEKPGYTTANFTVEANLLRYADVWEKIPLSDNDFAAYLHQNQKKLDPIEGVWSAGWPTQIGIIRDTTQPGRDFIAFMLNPDLPSWQKGYKKMDIARAAMPGAYRLEYYRNDFAVSKTTVTLDQTMTFGFMLNVEDKSYPVTFKKIATTALAP
jgi:hypothetical protein